MHIEVISDVICPWCFIGKRRLERAIAMRPGLDVRLLWRVFQLNPAIPPEGIPRPTYLAAKFGHGAQIIEAEVIERKLTDAGN